MTSKPALYYGLRSPPSRSVLMTAAAIGLELEHHALETTNNEELIKRNPCKTVPVLDDNGVIVNDSHVIIAYLVDKYAKDDSLYPKDPQKRRLIDTLHFFDACVLFPRVRLFADLIYDRGVTQIPDQDIEYLQKGYDLLEIRLANSPYLAGDHLTIADLSAVTVVTSGMPIAPLIEERHPKIKAWIERLSQLPYYKSINEAGLKKLHDFVMKAIEANHMAKV